MPFDAPAFPGAAEGAAGVDVAGARAGAGAEAAVAAGATPGTPAEGRTGTVDGAAPVSAVPAAVLVAAAEFEAGAVLGGGRISA